MKSVRAARDLVLAYRAYHLYEADPEATVPRLWMHIEAETLGSIEEARALAEPLLNHPPACELAAIWTELAELERRFGTPERARGVYRRALGKLGDLEQTMTLQAAYVGWEGCCGTLEQLRDAEGRCAARVRVLWTRRLQRAQQEHLQQQLALQSAMADDEARAAKRAAHNQLGKQKRKAKRMEAREVAQAADEGEDVGAGGAEGSGDSTGLGDPNKAADRDPNKEAAYSKEGEAPAKRAKLSAASADRADPSAAEPGNTAAAARAAASRARVAAAAAGTSPTASAAAPAAASSVPAARAPTGDMPKPAAGPKLAGLLVPRALKTSRTGGAPAPKPGRGTGAGRGGAAERAAPAAGAGGGERAEGEPGLTNEQIRRLMMSSSNGGESESAVSK